jgi:competence ComEA-like helix-hairpin-helix protein
MRKLTLRVLAVVGALASPVLAQTAAPPAPAGPTAPAPDAPSTSTVPSPQGALIDINSASKDELQQLAGIGPARAEAIIKARPYKGKDELHRKKIIPESVYNGIKDRVVARQKS